MPFKYKDKIKMAGGSYKGKTGTVVNVREVMTTMGKVKVYDVLINVSNDNQGVFNSIMEDQLKRI